MCLRRPRDKFKVNWSSRYVMAKSTLILLVLGFQTLYCINRWGMDNITSSLVILCIIGSGFFHTTEH